MRNLDQYVLLHDMVRRMRFQALRDVWNGVDATLYFEQCKWMSQRYLCTMIFTRDVGYHSSGWWKNPDYERCWHLSIAFPDGRHIPTIEKIIDALFGEHKKLIWVEPPYTDIGKKRDVWHYRLFCDEYWQPIKPRGEVYSTQFTEKGWKSFSELHAKI